MGSGASRSSKPQVGTDVTGGGELVTDVTGGGGELISASSTNCNGVACLIIDPQRSFHGGGSLAVSGADEVSPPPRPAPFYYYYYYYYYY